MDSLLEQRYKHRINRVFRNKDSSISYWKISRKEFIVQANDREKINILKVAIKQKRAFEFCKAINYPMLNIVVNLENMDYILNQLNNA